MNNKISKIISWIIAMTFLVCLFAGCDTQTADGGDIAETEAYGVTYLEYIAMPAEEKQSYMDKFPTTEEKLAFIQWLNDEEEKYEATKP